MTEVSLSRDQFRELSDQAGQIISIADALADIFLVLRDLRDHQIGGRDERRICPHCGCRYAVPEDLPRERKRYCSWTCFRATEGRRDADLA